MRHTFSFLLLLTLSAWAIPAQSQLRLARLFTDHAVLQRQKPIQVWGWAKPNEPVSVTFAKKTLKTQADVEGRWQVQFSAMEAGGPYNLLVEAASGKQERKDLLMGDVWLCSGQSNMEWPVSKADNYLQEQKKADYPQIRHFLVAHEVALEPVQDLASGEWKTCNTQTVGDFTAVGFFFAREVYEKTGVPIGLLHSSWGGSQVESWISKASMLKSNELSAYAQNFPKNWEEADILLERAIKKKLLGNPDANPTLEDEKKYLQPNFDHSGWLTADPMWQWDWKGIWAWRGNGFMAKTVDIPAEMTTQVTTLGLAELYSYNEVYINGKLISAGLFKGVRKLLIPANTWKAGANKLVIKMNRAIEPGWFGLGLMGAPSDLFVNSETRSINLAGNDWKLMPSFAEPHEFAHSSNNVGIAISNAMIDPLLPYSIRGALWYQGETNASRAYQYRHSFPLMIQDWRQRWGDEFPFYFVQLAPYGSYQNSNEGSPWAELREAQTLALQLPRTGMAVTMDIGNPNDIHPTNKQDVGHRLAVNALHFDYQKTEIPYSGPLYDTLLIEGDHAVLYFKFAENGLMAKDKFGYLKGFEIAGEDRVFHFAKAEIKGNEVVVYHPKGMRPAAVRYAWADAPVDANLFNKEGFPASPFRTDEWEGVTKKVRFE